MKRLMSVLLISILAVLAVSSAFADQQLKTSYYTMMLPDDWDIEAVNEKDGEAEILAYFAEPDDIGIVVEAGIIYYEDWKDFSLWNADKSEVQEYVDTIMEDFQDDEPEFLDIVNAGSIPFVLIRAKDSDGDYLYADTMSNGYAVIFMVYVTDGDIVYPITDKHIEQIKNILATFQPAA